MVKTLHEKQNSSFYNFNEPESPSQHLNIIIVLFSQMIAKWLIKFPTDLLQLLSLSFFF